MEREQTAQAASSITQAAYEKLRKRLLTGAILPGQRIRLNEVCTTLGTNQSAAREALSRLTAEGLAVSEPQKGFRAADLLLEDLRDLTDARIEIETLCIRHAIKDGDLAWEGRLADAAHQLTRLSGPDKSSSPEHAEIWSEAHSRFHAALCGGCKNKWLLRMRETLYMQSERYRWLAGNISEEERDVDAEHQAIIVATLARDAKKAASLLEQHLRRTADIILEANQPPELLQAGTVDARE